MFAPFLAKAGEGIKQTKEVVEQLSREQMRK